MNNIEFLGNAHNKMKKNWLILTIPYFFVVAIIQIVFQISNPVSSIGTPTSISSLFLTILLNGLSFSILYYCTYVKNGYKLLKFNYICGPFTILFSIITSCTQGRLAILDITQIALHIILFITWAFCARKLIAINKMYYRSSSDDALFSNNEVSIRKWWLLSLAVLLMTFTICLVVSLSYLDAQLVQSKYNYLLYSYCYLMFSLFVFLMFHHHCYKQLGNKLLVTCSPLLLIGSITIYMGLFLHFLKSIPLFVAFSCICLWFFWTSIKMFNLNRRSKKIRALS